jgi:hypothetical protein
MADQDDTVPRRQPEPRPFQFTLRTMFIITTVAAVGCAAAFWPTEGVRAIAVLYLIVVTPMAITVALIYGRGYVRTFCIGALFPAVATILFFIYFFIGELIGAGDDQAARYKIATFMGAYLMLVSISGVLAMGIRWMVESPERERKRERKREDPS